MVVTTTATTSTSTAPASSLPMNLLSGSDTNTTSFNESIGSPNPTMQPFTPGQCLFCPNSSSSFADSVIHMQKSHGLFVPYQQHLAVDLETLFKYLHLVIFGYRECIHCGTERSTVQAVQQHMAGKGHCTFDISDPDSEFAEFYDFSMSQDGAESDIKSDVESDDDERRETSTSSNHKPLLADEDSLRLPSGRIISRQTSTQAGPSITHLRRRTQTPASQLEYTSPEPEEEDGSGKEAPVSNMRDDVRVLSKREKRERAAVTYQLATMSANDRHSLAHLSSAQQRSLLATQHRQNEKVQREERRRQGKIDRKGNKNLYAYWHTETPVYQCG
ncbi:C2H2 type zinc-finger-domain-containing protein [Xylaria palmicola]|nr:C2H2 type zinc-finger-domain-containing protein [Xylaria palmicola]